MKLISRNGKLWVTFYHQSKRHRRSLRLDDTKQNRKLATNKIIPELVYKLNSGEFFKNENNQVPTVGEFAKVSFEIHKHERRELTQKSHLNVYNLHIKPYFGNTKIDKIKASDLAKWQNNLLEKITAKTLKAIRSVFNTILEDAMNDEIITKNPFKLVGLPKGMETIQKIPFSIEEIKKILDNAPNHMKAFFAIGFYTGMRTGEIIGLKWTDIDFQNKTIKVQRSRRQGIETIPKTKNSIRDVEIIDALMPYLQKHRDISDKNSIYVFETYKKVPFNTCDKISSHYWRKILKEQNIQYRNLYQMRHTFASLMISNGEDILWVSQMLGHKDASMTLQKYARYIKNPKRQRATFLN